jgi:hypothetical protein
MLLVAARGCRLMAMVLLVVGFVLLPFALLRFGARFDVSVMCCDSSSRVPSLTEGSVACTVSRAVSIRVAAARAC